MKPDKDQCNRLQVRPGRQPTLSDVARLTGVSTATVSRVLNRPGDVSPALRERVLAEIEAVGYVPHGAARTLASQRSSTVGAIISTLSNAIFATGLQAFEQRLDESGYTLLIAISEYDPDHALRHARSLLSRGVDGLMLIGQSHRDEVFELIRAKDLPYVTTWTYHLDGPHPSVGFDNRLAAYRLTRYLLEIGHRDIAMIAGISTHNDRARDRIVGVRDALADWDIELPSHRLIERGYEVAEGREALRLLMGSDSRPTAVVCGNDVLAMGALFECQALGLSVPGDVSIVGFDDLPLAAHLSPPLTTMAVPSELMGRKAAEYLLARFEGKAVPDMTELEVGLIVRETTAPPKGASRGV
ncbi:MAG: LacI family DNA-binding transcriptional regulator [Alphaproteobacteria bacterium]|nr:LacI family DNA-binding transcriptional regulator [Alphaproteobacteria bacterium]